jgi:aryl-alcohol dehydrogenase-like predicted oxidoreductase
MFERAPEAGLLDVLQEKGVGCIPFSPLAGGQLTNRYLNGIPQTHARQAAVSSLTLTSSPKRSWRKVSRAERPGGKPRPEAVPDGAGLGITP